MAPLATLDFETYSEAGMRYDFVAGKWRGPPHAPQSKKGLPVVGMAVYAMHPTTEVLSASYDLMDGHGLRRWRPGMPPPADLLAHVAAGGLLEAWNSGFEWWIWNWVCTRRYGWPPLPLEQMRCAMAKARAAAYPGSLDKAGEVMRLSKPKDPAGEVLLRRLSVPRNPTANNPDLRLTPATAPADFEALYRYNDRDVEAEIEASSRCPDLEGEELDFWLLDQRINRRGVAVDTPSLKACAALVEACLSRYDTELAGLTGGAVPRASMLAKLADWLRVQGVPVPAGRGAMDEEGITKLLKDERLPAPARRALEIRQLAGSASVKKVFSMLNQLAPDGRLHDLYNYHGARTGRPTGEGPQPTNLPKAGPKVVRCVCGRHSGAHRPTCAWCGLPFPPGKTLAEWGPEAMEDVLTTISGGLPLVEDRFGDAMLCVSGCLRGLFVAAPGHELICSDFNSIEGVVAACVAGEDWRVDMFRTHGKAYELGASKITGIPFAEIMAHAGYDDVTSPEWWKHRARKGEHHPVRQTIGKVSELASGFGGFLGAWKRFGADRFMDDEEMKRSILAWRKASPAIVHMWGGQERREGWERIPELFGLEGMAICAIQNREQIFPVRRLDGTDSGISYLYHDDALYCLLPSGFPPLTYRRARLVPSQRPWGGPHAIEYEGYNSNPQMGPVGWVTLDLYGGKAFENVVQKLARDIQRYAMLSLDRAGYPIVLHTYDEVVAEVKSGDGSVEEVERIMGTMPAWATYKGQPWPIRASGGWAGRRYRKA